MKIFFTANPQYSLMNSINLAERLEQQASRYSSYNSMPSTSKSGADNGKGLLYIPKCKESMYENVAENTIPNILVLNKIKCCQFATAKKWDISPTIIQRGELRLIEGSGVYEKQSTVAPASDPDEE